VPRLTAVLLADQQNILVVSPPALVAHNFVVILLLGLLRLSLVRTLLV
jgi:hypothetical protein